jgi:hypothetical protein
LAYTCSARTAAALLLLVVAVKTFIGAIAAAIAGLNINQQRRCLLVAAGCVGAVLMIQARRFSKQRRRRLVMIILQDEALRGRARLHGGLVLMPMRGAVAAELKVRAKAIGAGRAHHLLLAIVASKHEEVANATGREVGR